MQRTPEPELMDDAAQAAAYASADFSEPHDRIVDAFVGRFGDLRDDPDPRVLDLGCGSADVTVRLARALPTTRFVGVDGAPAMLAEGRRRIRDEGLEDRIELLERRLPTQDLGTGWSGVVSNSLLHHLLDPQVLWSAVAQSATAGTAVLVADLRRPESPAAADALVARLALGEPELLQRDFRASLHAAFRPEEVRGQLEGAGLGRWLAVEAFGDRHLLVSGRRPD